MLTHLVLGCVAAVAFGYAFYKWATNNNDYFAKRGIDYLKPTFLLGTTGGMMFGLYNMDTFLREAYGRFPEAKVVGTFAFRSPFLMLRDPAVIKQVVVKDFDHFEDHSPFLDPSVDQMFGNSLFVMTGQRWRDMRATLSPAFTGSKMRLMFGMVDECAVQMAAVLRERTAVAGVALRLDTKDMFGRLTTDVIATSAFGIKLNSFADEDNEFFVNSKRAMNFASIVTAIKFLFMMVCPCVLRWLGIQFIDTNAANFFRSVALNTIQTRLERKIYRPDMINLMAQLKQNRGVASVDEESTAAGTVAASSAGGFAIVDESHIGRERVQRVWNDTELAAQCFMFFVAGYDSTSWLLSFLFYELARNADVQEKLRAECDEMKSRLVDGRMTYEAMMGMKYMDQVVTETLRLWPPILLTDRICVRDYAYDDGDLRFEVKRGQSVWIPMFAIHRNAEYFPEPERFRPERFSDEHKDSIVAGSFIPFGVGPRNCIASRFALMEIKVVVYHTLLEFCVEPSAETPIPIRLAKAPGNMKPEKPIILALRRREAIVE